MNIFQNTTAKNNLFYILLKNFNLASFPFANMEGFKLDCNQTLEGIRDIPASFFNLFVL